VKLSANWMAACGEPGEDAALFDTVQAPSAWSCARRSASAIPVGKDSLSMRTQLARCRRHGAQGRLAPVSLIVTAFATLADVRGTLTPQLQPGDTTLILVDLGRGQKRLARLACWRRRWAASAVWPRRRARPRRPAAAEGRCRPP
jgi:phosphoribosylformylglycinamidine synthase